MGSIVAVRDRGIMSQSVGGAMVRTPSGTMSYVPPEFAQQGPNSVPVSASNAFTLSMPGGGRGMLGVITQGVAVTEANDILEVSIDKPVISLKPGETVKIEVTVKRRPDYTKPITLDVRVQHLGQVFSNPLPPGVILDEGASKKEALRALKRQISDAVYRQLITDATTH